MKVQEPAEKVRKTIIPVPACFKSYLITRKNLFWLTMFAVLGLAFYLPSAAHVLRNGTALIPQSLVLFAGAYLWSIQKGSTWRYVLEENYFLHQHRIQLIAFGLRGLLWDWRPLVFSEADPSGVRLKDIRQERWQDLPALRIEVWAKRFWKREMLWMVYAPEDEETVRARVLPLLEKHRRQEM